MEKIIINLCNSWSDWIEVCKNIKSDKIVIKYENFSENENFDEYKLIIPLSISSIINTLDNCEHEKSKLLCPNKEILKLCDNKIEFSKFMTENYTNNIPKMVNDINDYPYLAKHKYGIGGQNIFYIQSENDYINYKIDDDYLLQKYVKTNNYIVGQYVCKNGKIIFKSFYKTDICDDFTIIKGKLNKYHKIIFENDQILIEIFEKLNYTGFACVDFTFIDNNVVIFEINPRVGGTFMNDKSDFNQFIDIILNNNI